MSASPELNQLENPPHSEPSTETERLGKQRNIQEITFIQSAYPELQSSISSVEGPGLGLQIMSAINAKFTIDNKLTYDQLRAARVATNIGLREVGAANTSDRIEALVSGATGAEYDQLIEKVFPFTKNNKGKNKLRGPVAGIVTPYLRAMQNIENANQLRIIAGDERRFEKAMVKLLRSQDALLNDPIAANAFLYCVNRKLSFAQLLEKSTNLQLPEIDPELMKSVTVPSIFDERDIRTFLALIDAHKRADAAAAQIHSGKVNTAIFTAKVQGAADNLGGLAGGVAGAGLIMAARAGAIAAVSIAHAYVIFEEGLNKAEGILDRRKGGGDDDAINTDWRPSSPVDNSGDDFGDDDDSGDNDGPYDGL